MIGIPDVYVKRQFYSPPELDRATDSSYEDYDKEILLPGDEMEHVLTCVYSDIPAELALPEVRALNTSLIAISICLGYSVLYQSYQ